MTKHPQAYLRVEQMRVHHGSFDVIQIGVVFESSLQQTRLLTQLSYVRTVIVGEHLVPQDGICYLMKVHSHMKTQIVFSVITGEVAFCNQDRHCSLDVHLGRVYEVHLKQTCL